MHGASLDQVIDREQQRSEFLLRSTKSEASLELSVVARAKSEPSPPYKQKPSELPPKPAVAWRRAIARFLRSMLRKLATLAIFLVAVLVSLMVWDQYVIAPWTRDGRVRVQVASVAP